MNSGCVEIMRKGIVLWGMTGLVILVPPATAAEIASKPGITVAQTESATVISKVEVETTDRGLELILTSPSGREPQTFRTTYGETLVIDLINTRLQLPSGDRFQQSNLGAGIRSLEVIQQYQNTVRVKLVGETEIPTAEVTTTEQGFALTVNPEFTTAEEPTPEPETTPAPSPMAEVEETEPIELIVTATRTAEQEEDIPRSVTVITREELEEQTNLTTNLPDLLGKTVPGLGPPTQRFTNFPQTLRGRAVQVLIDGVPISTNQNTAGATELRSISPSAIEQIEVVRGPSSVFGTNATGGVINIITRTPTEERITQTAETRINSRGDFEGESFGTYAEYGLSGNFNQFDYTLNASWETFGFAFDGEGDRVPFLGASPENGRAIDLLGKVGVDFTQEQRLQVSVNHFDDTNEIEFINNPNPGEDAEKARALERDIEFIGLDDKGERQFTNISVNYSHDNILNSQLRLQGFYRDNFNRFAEPFEFGGDAVVAQQESERWGGRLELETDFSPRFNLLLGADYSQENLSQPYQRIDAEEFIESDFTVARFVEDVFWTPPYEVENLGLFAQGQWDISSRWLLSGGIRYENIGLSADDYTAVLFLDNPIDVGGGSINADDVVFNIGTVYDLTEELNVFANFSQGFGVPDFGRLLRDPPDGFRSLEDDLDFTAPQKVDNYELGLRGQWDNVQFSLAGFYNYSDFGVSFIQLTDPLRIQVARGPRRIYGIEATVDWQPSPTWQLGGLISWNEGEDDQDEDGDFDPIGTRDIQPLKITAYVENQTTPGWRNRLQALLVGGRDRAFDPDNGPDFSEIESYVVLDYISSIQLGPGSLQIGIQNLLDEEYFPISSQLFSAFGASNRVAAPGRTISVGYQLDF